MLDLASCSKGNMDFLTNPVEMGLRVPRIIPENLKSIGHGGPAIP